jgi:hypothetical protein
MNGKMQKVTDPPKKEILLEYFWDIYISQFIKPSVPYLSMVSMKKLPSRKRKFI